MKVPAPNAPSRNPTQLAPVFRTSNAMTTYITARAHGKRITGLPIFLARASHHGAVVYNTRSGITSPKDLEGRRGENAERVRRFGERLAAMTGLPLEQVGETLTSVEAAARLRQAGIGSRREPGRIDAVAAQILLQEVLDRG